MHGEKCVFVNLKETALKIDQRRVPAPEAIKKIAEKFRPIYDEAIDKLSKDR